MSIQEGTAGDAMSLRANLITVPGEPAQPARLSMADVSTLGLTPGDCVDVSGVLAIPALPGPLIEPGQIELPRAIATKAGLVAGESVSLSAAPPSQEPVNTGHIGFADVGGLEPELARLREMVELPLMRPDLFAQLGIAPPRGVLMHGPPGCGKTLIARALARETKATFFQIAGPEIADKHFGASEAKLRDIFEAARSAAPAIVFIDEIESIAPARESLSGDRQAERRMVAQLLTLMDGLDARGDVVVLAATNLPDMIDPALRRPGRFDREIPFSAPDAAGRASILGVHTRAMPLDKSVDLPGIAARTHGFVGADLASLTQEAGMAALRRWADAANTALSVHADDFESALTQVRPSALRALQVDVPITQWSDIVGAEEAKDALQQAVEWPLRYPAHFSHLGLAAPTGILLHGPPGTGKTLLARALANAADANFIAINAGELLSMYLGESERAIRSLFVRARASAPCVLFFDELDALAMRRSANVSETTGRVVAHLLTELDGLSSSAGIFVLAATNRIRDIDPAILRPGRFDAKILVDLPDLAGREVLMALYFSSVPTQGFDPSAVAKKCDGFSGADVAELARRARQIALARALASDPDAAPTACCVTQTDVLAALTMMRGQAS